MKGSYSIEAKDHCDIPIRYEGTFKLIERSSTGPSLIDFTAVGNVTFKYSSTEATCGSFVPPTADSLQYCYYLESAEETWTAPNISTEDCNYFPHDAQFSYANDGGSHGGIRITLRSPDPTYSDIYSLWFGSNAKTMEVDTTDSSPTNVTRRTRSRYGCLSTRSPACTLQPPPSHGSPGGRSRVLTVDVGQTVLTTVTWSWDLSPIFEE